VYLSDGNRIVLVASNVGEPDDPQWYRNIVADQNVTLEIDGDARAMHAVTASDDERARLWPLMVAQNPSYDELQKKTDRAFPIVICTWNI
jgi:deazaflavin-dependent oxidoreductase (nitroreductase family)